MRPVLQPLPENSGSTLKFWSGLVYVGEGDIAGYEHAGHIRSNLIPENQWITYSDDEFDISLELPFNTEWGTDIFSLDPVEKEINGFFFGPLGGCEGGGFCRYDKVIVEPATELSKKLKALRKDKPDAEIEEKTIGTHKVIESRYNLICETIEWHIFGPKYSYIFMPVCDSPEARVTYEKIIGSVTFPSQENPEE